MKYTTKQATDEIIKKVDVEINSTKNPLVQMNRDKIHEMYSETLKKQLDDENEK